MQAPNRYPVGVQVFEKMRTMGYLYVDKTRFIWNMANSGGSYYFLSRPRRFGKTLLVSTMEAYFQGRRELFAGLDIERLDARTTWPAHPVLHFDLSTVKSSSIEGLERELDMVLRRMERRFGREEGVEGWSPRVESLITRAAATSEEGVVVLVDEYDAPLLNVMHDPGRLQRFREVMREFYAPLKACEDQLRFVFITGISKFSQLSIFSELNNLQNVSLMPQYADVCGITADELDAAMAPDVAYLAEQIGISPEACREQLRERYDGYHFSKDSPDIYNPFSLVSAINTGQIVDYWFGSGTPTALVNTLRASGVEVPALEGVNADAAEFDAPTEGMSSPVAFMYQSGYLTIKGYDPVLDTYRLGIPNAEVRRGLYSLLLPAYSGESDATSRSLVRAMTRALLGGDVDTALCQLRSFLAGIPYDLAAKDEKGFQSIIYLVFKLVGIHIETEVRIATGRIDVLLDTSMTRYVLELKYRRAGERHPTAADAMAQIDEKGYLIPYQADEKPVVKVGVAYSEETRTLDEGWIVERE